MLRRVFDPFIAAWDKQSRLKENSAKPSPAGGRILGIVRKTEDFLGNPILLLREAGNAVVRFHQEWGEADRSAEWERKVAEL